MIDRKWLKKQAEKARAADYIDPALYAKYGVKRGLRNDNGSGVLVGLTTIGNVIDPALITWLIIHCLRAWSCTDHVTNHELISWL